jgi:hypothetical protein
MLHTALLAAGNAQAAFHGDAACDPSTSLWQCTRMQQKETNASAGIRVTAYNMPWALSHDCSTGL